MLMLVDKTDFEQLEKYGFEKEDITKYTKTYTFKKMLESGIYSDLSFSQKTGNLLYCYGDPAIDLLYTLIQDGMIKKISDKQ